MTFALDDQDFFELDVDRYAPALGEKGVTACRHEIDRRLQEVMATGSRVPYGLRRAQERLAIVDGDLGQLATLVGGDLNNPLLYLLVVTTLQEIGEDDAAFEWALRGLDEKGDDRGGELSRCAVTGHLDRRGEAEQALAIRREGLRSRPDATMYARLAASQGAAQQLADRGLGDGVDELDPLGHLVAGQRRPGARPDAAGNRAAATGSARFRGGASGA